MSEKSAFWEVLERKIEEGKRVCLNLDDNNLDSDGSKIDPMWLGRELKNLVCACHLNPHNIEDYVKDWETTIKSCFENIFLISDDRNFSEDFRWRANAVVFNPQGLATVPKVKKDEGLFVVCRSGSQAARFQCKYVTITPNQEPELFEELMRSGHHNSLPLYEYIAYVAKKDWNKFGNCGLFVKTSEPGEVKNIRQRVGPEMPIMLSIEKSLFGDGAFYSYSNKIKELAEVAKGQGPASFFVDIPVSFIYNAQEDDALGSARVRLQALNNVLKEV